MKSLSGKSILLALLFGLVVCLSSGSEPDDIKKKQTQLEKLRKEIDLYEKRIVEKEKKEKSTLGLVENYDRQSILLKKLINKLDDQEKSLQNDIGDTKLTIKSLGGQLSYLKKQYANYITTAYKFGRTYDLELLLSSKSFNQLLIRSEYLQRFSSHRKEDLDKIDTKKTTLEEETAMLENQLAQQHSLLAEKKREEQNLKAKTKRRKQLLTEIRREKKNDKQELDRKKKDIRELENIIAKLIDEDRAKKNKTAEDLKNDGTLNVRKGRLPWPVDGGTVVGRFGNQQHPTLGTITQNTGVDISVPTGTNVQAVADGEVSKIYWLPSYGNLLILNHKDGFRTVYAHLSEITVDEGNKVAEGTLIGKTGESISGSQLHFEIYKDREKLDPEKWLQPRGRGK